MTQKELNKYLKERLNHEYNLKYKPRLSHTSKMPCASFALPIKETCNGRFNPDGSLKEICEGCYADKGMYLWNNAINLRENNYLSTLENDFTGYMIDLILVEENKGSEYFRWFDSGDVYSSKFLLKLFTICQNTPNTKHWIPTKSRDLYDQFIWEALEPLPNVTVRFSSDSKFGVFDLRHKSTVIQPDQEVNKKLVFKCKAKSIGLNKKGKANPKKCHNCRACWTNDKVIAYEFH